MWMTSCLAAAGPSLGDCDVTSEQQQPLSKSGGSSSITVSAQRPIPIFVGGLKYVLSTIAKRTEEERGIAPSAIRAAAAASVLLSSRAESDLCAHTHTTYKLAQKGAYRICTLQYRMEKIVGERNGRPLKLQKAEGLLPQSSAATLPAKQPPFQQHLCVVLS